VIEKLLVVEDQPVEHGEAVAEMTRDDAKLAYDRAVANLNLCQAELQEAKAYVTATKTHFEQPVHLQATLAEAESALAKVNTELKNIPFAKRRAEADHEAAQSDFEGKSDSQEVVARIEIDEARSRMQSAKALVEELADRLDSLTQEQSAMAQRRDALKTQLELLADETKAKDEALARQKAAEARVKQAEVAVAEAKLRLDRMTVRAPITGRIFRLVAHPGSQVGKGGEKSPGSDGSTVVTMYDPHKLQIRVDVRFEDIPKVLLGQPVEIDNPALEKPITGQVLFVSSEADIQKNTLQVKVEIPRPPSFFKPEMLVDVTFLAPSRPDSNTKPSREVKLFLPRQFLRESEEGTFVWIADRSEGIARKTDVEVAATGNNDLVEITQGLTVASRVIASGTDGLRDGERIVVTGEASTQDFSNNPIPSNSDETE